MTIIIPHFRQCIKIAAFRRENLWLLFSCGEAQNLPLSNLSCNSFICFLCRRLSIWLNSCCVFAYTQILNEKHFVVILFFLNGVDTVFARVDCEGRSAGGSLARFRFALFFPNPKSYPLLGMARCLVAEFSDIGLLFPCCYLLLYQILLCFCPRNFREFHSLQRGFPFIIVSLSLLICTHANPREIFQPPVNRIEPSSAATDPRSLAIYRRNSRCH